jgi:hypothetical protein
MSKLIDFLTFKDLSVKDRKDLSPTLRKDERDTAILAGKYPPDGADVESNREYRLASLMQYPHY